MWLVSTYGGSLSLPPPPSLLVGINLTSRCPPPCPTYRDPPFFVLSRMYGTNLLCHHYLLERAFIMTRQMYVVVFPLSCVASI
jgi:hypothetical protein